MAASSSSTIIAGKAYVLIEAKDNTAAVLKAVGDALEKVNKKTNKSKGLLGMFQKLSSTLKEVASRLVDIGSKMNRLGGKMVGAGFGMGALTMSSLFPIKIGIQQAKEFRDSMNTVQAILGITNDKAASLEKVIRRLGATTTFTSKEVADAASALARGGFSQEEIEQSLEGVMNLARTGAVDIPTAANTMVRAIRAFGMQALDANRVSDMFFEAQRQGTSTIYELASALSFSAGTSDMMGLSLAETLGVLSKISNSMLQGTKGGTSFNQMLLRMATESDKVKDVFKFDVFSDDGSVKPAQQLFKGLRDGMRNLPNEQRIKALADIFNVRGMRATAAFFKQFDEINEAIKKIEESEGEAEKATKTMNQGIVGSVMKITSALNELAISFGDTFSGPLEAISIKMIPVINGLSAWVQKNKDVGYAILKVVGGMLAFSAALIGIGILLKIAGFALMTLGTIIGTGLMLAPLAIKIGVVLSLLKNFTYLPGRIGLAFQSLLDALFGNFNEMIDMFGKLFSIIKERIMAGDIEGAMNILMIGLVQIFHIGWINMKKGWLEFTFFIKSAFIEAIGGIKIAWAEMQTWLSKKMLEFASDNDFFNWLFEKVSGVDIQKENLRTSELGNTENRADAILNQQLNDRRSEVIDEQNKALEELTKATQDLKDSYDKEKTQAKEAINQAIKVARMTKPEQTGDIGTGGVMVPTFNLDDYRGAGTQVKASQVSGLEMGSKEAATKAHDNQKKMTDAMVSTSKNTAKIAANTENLPEFEGV